jgi:hypothetical protein
MRNRAHLLVVMVLGLAVAEAEGRGSRPLREARSQNGRYHLRIDAGRGEQRRCRAALFERAPAQARERQVWRARLRNEVAPCRALIRDDGCFVVTLDEFRRGGAAHALVIYDERGKLLREFDLRELLQGDDWKHVTVAQRAIDWLSEAEFAFADSPPQFVIALKWGHELRIDLEQIELVGSQATNLEPGGHGAAPLTTRPGSGAADDAIPPEVLALLTAANSSAGDQAPAATGEIVQRALLELHRLATLAGVEVEGLPQAAARAAAALPPDGSESAAGGPDHDGVATAGNSATTAVPVPAPDPANPVDYVAWMQEQTRTEGPSAVPYYQAAIDAVVEWQGDPELFGAALDGDPDALASPEISAWLAANRDALDQFRAATDLEFRGMPLDTADGTVIGFLLPHLSKSRLLAKAAVLEARQLEAAGDVDAAMGCYLDVLAAGAHAGQGPTLIENLVGIAVQAMGSDRTLDAFARLADDEVDYAVLAEALVERYRPTRPIEETFQFERVMILDVIQRAYDWNPDTGHYRVSETGVEQFTNSVAVAGAAGTSSELMFGFVLGNIGFENMTKEVNDYYDAMTDAAQMPYQEGRAAFRDMEAAIADPGFHVRNPFLATLMPAFGRAVHLAARSESNRRATLLVTQLKAYRQRYGVYPDSLDVFGDAEATIDPFTDQRFAYRRAADDFVLYSLGGNGLDDGGVHDRRGDTNDLLYWPRPPKD